MGNSVLEYGELWATPSTAQARHTCEHPTLVIAEHGGTGDRWRLGLHAGRDVLVDGHGERDAGCALGARP